MKARIFRNPCLGVDNESESKASVSGDFVDGRVQLVSHVADDGEDRDAA